MSSTTSDSIRIAGLENDSITDGPGLRLALFVQGCKRDCPGCHNPEATSLDGGQLHTVSGIFATIRKNPLLTGVTFSGGEPLLQAGPLARLAEMIRAEGLELAIYTGYTFEEIIRESDPDVLALLSLADTLIDGPFVLSRRNLSLRFRGSENQRILDLPASLAAGAAVLAKDTDWTGENAPA